jgi:hypothetical protein
MGTHNRSGSADNARGYILIHYDWYELEDEMDPLRRNAIVSTLNPHAFQLPANAQIVKRGYQVLEPADVTPFAFTICECRPVAHPFDTLEDALEFLEEHGVKQPRLGFNPIV